MFERRVEFAFGFEDGTWRRVTINVPEREDRVLDEAELIDKAKEIATSVGFEGREIAFQHVLFVEDPVGGYGDD